LLWECGTGHRWLANANSIRSGSWCPVCAGRHGNEFKGDIAVKQTDLYDIASVSKIAGSTIGAMKLASEGKFSLSKSLNDYLPDLVLGKYKTINIREMMAHQAGLPAWIAFYKKTLSDGSYKDGLYSTTKKAGYETQVAENLFILDSYADSIYQQIMAAPLGEKTYVYSDLGYYFIKKIVEKQSGQAFDAFLYEQIYRPMGLRSICFNPLKYFSSANVAPTENDQAFRKQLIRGYVHDPGAAMLGGVAGHAGVFSNATDLASLMQMLMNNGVYGNVRYLQESVVQEYTRAQFSGNRRGAGFDRPKASGGGTCCALATQSSYGHSGFTGTLVWADPARVINYVFLSNRVCPDQENWKLRDMNIRTEIQRVIYEALAGK
jgi:CubicO group peptidase (beta-lactamase class C family)